MRVQEEVPVELRTVEEVGRNYHLRSIDGGRARRCLLPSPFSFRPFRPRRPAARSPPGCPFPLVTEVSGIGFPNTTLCDPPIRFVKLSPPPLSHLRQAPSPSSWCLVLNLPAVLHDPLRTGQAKLVSNCLPGKQPCGRPSFVVFSRHCLLGENVVHLESEDAVATRHACRSPQGRAYVSSRRKSSLLQCQPSNFPLPWCSPPPR